MSALRSIWLSTIDADRLAVWQQQVRTATKRGGGSSKNGRSSAGRRLGVKKFTGELAESFAHSRKALYDELMYCPCQTNTFCQAKSSSVNGATNSTPAKTSARARITRYTPSNRDTSSSTAAHHHSRTSSPRRHHPHHRPSRGCRLSSSGRGIRISLSGLRGSARSGCRVLCRM